MPHTILLSVLARPALFIFCFKCLFRGLDRTGWLPVTAELREEGTIVLQFGFFSLYFDFEGWGLGAGREQCPEARSSSQCKSEERSPSAPRDHVSFPCYIPHMPCWIQEGIILLWKISHILNIDKNDLNFNSVLGDALSPLPFSQERRLFLSALVVKTLCTIWTCWLSNHMVSCSVFFWKCMAASTWGSVWIGSLLWCVIRSSTAKDSLPGLCVFCLSLS